MLSFFLRKGDRRAEHQVVKGFAILGLVVVPNVRIDMVLSGQSVKLL